MRRRVDAERAARDDVDAGSGEARRELARRLEPTRGRGPRTDEGDGAPGRGPVTRIHSDVGGSASACRRAG